MDGLSVVSHTIKAGILAGWLVGPCYGEPALLHATLTWFNPVYRYQVRDSQAYASVA